MHELDAPVAIRYAEKHQESDLVEPLSRIDSMHALQLRKRASRWGLGEVHWTGVRAAVFGTNAPHACYPRLQTEINPCPRVDFQIDSLDISVHAVLPAWRRARVRHICIGGGWGLCRVPHRSVT